MEPQSEFIITVQDINDNVPQFQNEPYVSSIPEMCLIGKLLMDKQTDSSWNTQTVVFSCYANVHANLRN